jgi:UDP-N-acetylmuramoyl-tripeptide--D-alanyl-D-alanine ligase
MRYGLRDLAEMMRTPFGRNSAWHAVLRQTWPLMWLVAAVYRRTLARRCRVVTVVGSYGKTTTARAVTAALGPQTPSRVSSNSWTALSRAMFRVRPQHSHAVFEVGIGDVGQMDPYAFMLQPDIAVVTCIGSEHNLSLRRLEVTRREKARMVRAVPASGLVVLNADDAHVLSMARAARARVVTYGFAADSDVRAERLRAEWPRGMRFQLHAGGRRRAVRVRLFGRAMVYPVLAAVAVGLAEGLDLDDVLTRLETLPPSPGRLEPVPLPNGAYLLRDDYKSALETVGAALDALALVPARRRLVVMGDVSEAPGSPGPLYRSLGLRIGETASWALMVGRQHQRYAVGAARAGMPKERLVRVAGNVVKATETLRRELREGDAVLLKGRNADHLERIALMLHSRPVRCHLPTCQRKQTCDTCPMVERGWGGRRPMS